MAAKFSIDDVISSPEHVNAIAGGEHVSSGREQWERWHHETQLNKEFSGERAGQTRSEACGSTTAAAGATGSSGSSSGQANLSKV